MVQMARASRSLAGKPSIDGMGLGVNYERQPSLEAMAIRTRSSLLLSSAIHFARSLAASFGLVEREHERVGTSHTPLSTSKVHSLPKLVQEGPPPKELDHFLPLVLNYHSKLMRFVSID